MNSFMGISASIKLMSITRSFFCTVFVLVQKVRVRLILNNTRTFVRCQKFFCPNCRTQHFISVVYEDQCASDLFDGTMNICAKYSVFYFK